MKAEYDKAISDCTQAIQGEQPKVNFESLKARLKRPAFVCNSKPLWAGHWTNQSALTTNDPEIAIYTFKKVDMRGRASQLYGVPLPWGGFGRLN
jgi:hypothetical protein